MTDNMVAITMPNIFLLLICWNLFVLAVFDVTTLGANDFT